jgi:hypothetical protein
MSRSVRLLYIALTLIGAVFVLTYKGAGWEFIRGHIGDWLVVQFIYLVARFWVSDRHRYVLAGGILLLCVGVEVVKFFTSGSIPRTFFAEITLGSTFDPLDMIAFILGLVTVLLVERFLSARKPIPLH